MTRWKPLPADVAPQVRDLVDRLRELKDQVGISRAELARKTSYSRSSWERCLNGKTLPPRQAVAALVQLVGEPAGRPLALWERAQTRWTRHDAKPQTAAIEQGVPAPPPPSLRHRLGPRGWALATLAPSIVVVAALTFSLPGIESTPVSSNSSTYTIGCRGAQCTGHDPYAAACDVDAVSFAGLQVGPAYLELRISGQCGAAWARISHSAVGDRVLVIDHDDRTETATVVDDAFTEQYVSTPMIAADRHSQVRACMERNGKRRCTLWGTSSPVPVPPHGEAQSHG